MALVVKDRVKVTTTTTGTGTLTLGSAVAKFQDFSVIGDGNTTYYAIESGTDWEVGVGTYTASGTTLSRDTILESSNAGSAINLSGTSTVFCTYPAERSVNTASPHTFTANQTINGDLTVDTNTLYVDSTNNRVGIGTSSPTVPLTIGDSTLPAGVTINGAMISTETASALPLLNIRLSASSGNPQIAQYVSSGTASSPTAVASGRALGRNNWYGFDGTNYINSSAIATFVDGTVSTGIVPGRINFYTAGTGGGNPIERMRIDSSGNVGIGTSSPQLKLTVKTGTDQNFNVGGPQTLSDGVRFTSTNDAGTLNLGMQFAGSVFAWTSTGTERMRIDSSGNVGIGTSSPDALLTVNTIASFGAGAAATPSIAAKGDLNTGMWFPAADTIAFSEGGVEAMRIDSSGDVGIGTSSPSSSGPLSIERNGNASSELNISLINGISNKECIVNFGNNLATADRYKGRIFYQTDNNVMGFWTNTTERMRIDSSGNVGIGTSSPTSPLTVNGGVSDNDFVVGYDITGNKHVSSRLVYDRTSASAANIVVGDSGVGYAMRRSTSSIKYKTNVQDAIHGLDKVLQLRSVTYKGKNDGDKIFGGLIAEEVDAIGLNEFVIYDENNEPDSLAYSHMVSLAFKAIQEQQELIKALEARIQTLENK